MARTVAVLWTALVLLAPFSAGGQDAKKADPSLEQDLQSLQGTWERTGAPADVFLNEAQRVVKQIDGNKETVTWYGKDGLVILSQRAEFELSRSGKVRIFTFSNIEVLEGPGKGQKASIKGSYIYRIRDDLFVEAGGLLTGEPYSERSPYLLKWKKVSNVKE